MNNENEQMERPTLKAFAIWDVKAEVYGVPFFMRNKWEAMRAFKDLANDPNTTVGRHPEDYKLTAIGSFDDESGNLQAYVNHESLAWASEMITRKKVTE